MENSKELIQINQLPFFKEDIDDFANKIIAYLNSGEGKASDVLLRFKGIEKVFEIVKSKLSPLVVDEISKYGKEVTLNGALFKVQELGTKYDFTNTGDTVWQRLKEQAEKVNKALKEREDFLKGIKESETLVDQETGEVITVYPAVKTSTTGVTVSIK